MLERHACRLLGLDCTNWSGAANYEDTEVTGFDQTVSHDFKIVWKADEIA